MALSIYKSGQGYYTRMLSAISVGVIVLCGVVWLWAKLTTVDAIPTENMLYYQAGSAVGVIAFFGILVFVLLNKPRIADFMIATEGEMKKVNWPSKKEIIGSTWVVILGTAFIACLLFTINIGFTWFFRAINLLEG